MITIDKIEDLETFANLRDEWNELLSNSNSDCLFLTWEWAYTWWQHLAEERRLQILVARHKGRLVGIAPLAWRARRWRRLLPFPALEFIGAGSAGSDYLDFIIRRGEERQTLLALTEYLAGSKLMLELSRVRSAASNACMFALETMRRGWRIARLVTDICPFIDLSSHSWESYLASLGTTHRYNMRRRLRNLEKEWYVSFDRVECEQMRGGALRTLVELHGRRWRERKDPGAFNSRSLVNFHDELSRLALERGWLRLFVLRLNGVAAAALYGFNYHDTFYFYQSGFDPKLNRHSVGLVTMGLAIKHAIEEKVKIYDFLRGDEPYKFLWAHDQRELIRLELFPMGERGVLYQQIVKLRCGIKKMKWNDLPSLGLKRV
jgi:CelD/BcsL family acetyltransferase involved in cellulose biosynthesis